MAGKLRLADADVQWRSEGGHRAMALPPWATDTPLRGCGSPPGNVCLRVEVPTIFRSLRSQQKATKTDHDSQSLARPFLKVYIAICHHFSPRLKHLPNHTCS